MTLRTATLAALLLAPTFALADAEDDDKLCEVIGEAPNVSVPPKDRLWFKENCICAGAVGCGKLESKRFSQRLDAAKKAREAAAAATKAARTDAARKKKKTEAEEHRLRLSVMELIRTVESSDKRFEICVKMAERTVDPGGFCRRVEAEFIDTPEGQAMYKASVTREAAERLERVREACRTFHTCVESKRSSCADEFRQFEQTCGDAHFDATAPRSSTNYPDYLCRNKAGPCD
jgi:hypothetical protein